MNNKAGSITLNGYFNYDLEQDISHLGYEPETIIIDTNYLYTPMNSLNTVAAKLKGKTIVDITKGVVKKSKRFALRLRYVHRQTIRNGKFAEFSNTYQYEQISVCEVTIFLPISLRTMIVLSLDVIKFEILIVYGPSFSVSSFPDVYIESFKEWRCDFKKLSVRKVNRASLHNLIMPKNIM